MEKRRITIAIDGYSSCGKSTMAKELARNINYVYVDSGAMFRAVTLFALQHNIIINNIIDDIKLKAFLQDCNISFNNNCYTENTETYLNGKNVESEIRTMEVSNFVSRIAQLPFVRKALLIQQHKMGKEKGIVMDGRDIGTTVFPDAEMKVFVTASPEIRAQRRYEELKAKGQNISIEQVLRNVKERDYIDSHRTTSPLRQATDAIVLDNSCLSREEQLKWLLNLFNKIIQNQSQSS